MIKMEKNKMEKNKSIEASALHMVLLMAQQSSSPPVYDAFIIAYNNMIEIRGLDLNKIDA